MKMKKIMALIMAAALAVTSLAACGNGSGKDNDPNKNSGLENAEPVVFPLEEKMTFTGLAVMNGQYALTDSLAWQMSLDRANIDFNLTNVLSSEMTEKRNLLLNSGDKYPDVLIKTGVPANQYGLEGILIPLEDLIRKYAPNLTAMLDKTDGWDYITAEDGHVYSLPMQNDKYAITTPMWINKRWLDNLGLAEPTSYDELYQVLKAFKEKDANGNGDPNDEIPYTANTSTGVMYLMAYQNYAYDNDTYLAVIDGKLQYVCTHESYKEFLAFARKLYQEGLLDKNAFTQNTDQMRTKGQSADLYGAFFDNASFQVVGRENDDDYIILTPFQEGTFPIQKPWADKALAITDLCEHPEVVVAWADYFYTEEGARLAWMGVEGETYQLKEDGSWEWLLGNGYGDSVATVRASSTIQGTAVHPSAQPEIWYNMSAEIDPDEVYLNQQREKIYALGTLPIPVLNYSLKERETIADIKADVDSYVSQYLAQVVTGQIALDSSWDSYVKTLKDMGLEQMMEIYSKAYEKAK